VIKALAAEHVRVTCDAARNAENASKPQAPLPAAPSASRQTRASRTGQNFRGRRRAGDGGVGSAAARQPRAEREGPQLSFARVGADAAGGPAGQRKLPSGNSGGDRLVSGCEKAHNAARSLGEQTSTHLQEESAHSDKSLDRLVKVPVR